MTSFLRVSRRASKPPLLPHTIRFDDTFQPALERLEDKKQWRRWPRGRHFTRIWIFFFALLVFWICIRNRWSLQAKLRSVKNLNMASHRTPVEKGLVMATRRGEELPWLLELSPEYKRHFFIQLPWTPYIYTTATPPEPGFHLVPSVRGREAIAYLSFIIDNYQRLPAISVFVHSANNQWHNDILGPYTSTLLRNLRIDTVNRLGYVNLRCSHEPGCPLAVNPNDPSAQDLAEQNTRALFPTIYSTLFNVSLSAVPKHIGGVCCGQFAVSEAQIRLRPVTDYMRMRDWILHDSVGITDSFGVGWVFEKVWHIVFGMEAVYCPTFEQCRCDLFGWCEGKPVPAEYVRLVKSAHPWWGWCLGERFGNNNAVGATDIMF